MNLRNKNLVSVAFTGLALIGLGVTPSFAQTTGKNATNQQQMHQNHQMMKKMTPEQMQQMMKKMSPEQMREHHEQMMVKMKQMNQMMEQMNQRMGQGGEMKANPNHQK